MDDFGVDIRFPRSEAADPNLVTLSVYQSVGWWGIGIGVVVLLLAPFVKRLMHLDKLTAE